MLLYLSEAYLIGMALWLAFLFIALFGLLRLRSSARGRKWARAAVNAGLSAWMLAALLTSCELVFALFVDQTDAFNATLISRRWFQRHVESQRNAFGARDARPFRKSVPEGVSRIAFFGDSITVGHGIPEMADRFSDRVGAALEEHQPGRFHVANLADAGLEISMIEARLHGILREGYALDRAVYVICLNDIEGYHRESKAKIGRLQEIQPPSFLFSKTYFLNWAFFRYVQATRPEVSTYSDVLRDSYFSEAWEGFRGKLEQMHRRCRAHGVRLHVVIFPLLQNLGSGYSFREVHEKIAGYCESAGIPVLDLEPVFRHHAEEDLVVNAFDGHPNERAHAIAAEAIFKHLREDLARSAGEPDSHERKD